jgi:hypothetical protein
MDIFGSTWARQNMDMLERVPGPDGFPSVGGPRGCSRSQHSCGSTWTPTVKTAANVVVNNLDQFLFVLKKSRGAGFDKLIFFQ